MASQRDGGIEWCDETWNPVRGCSRVSAGCEGCYAERVAARFSGPGMPYEGLARRAPNGEPRWTGKVVLVPEQLEQPLRWKRPRRIFVNSMSDLFHESLSDDAIDQVFAIMALSRRHTFQILTKRADRMRDYFTRLARRGKLDGLATAKPMKAVAARIGGLAGIRLIEHAQVWSASHPLSNVWLGVSVEHQEAAAERIPLLLQTPAAVRFLSVEPLLGPVDLRRARAVAPEDRGMFLPGSVLCDDPLCVRGGNHYPREHGCRWSDIERHGAPPAVDWVIVGGESGPKARPMHPSWARDLRDQCVAAGVPFFFKQWGEWSPNASNYKLSSHRYAYESRRFTPDAIDYNPTEPDGYSLPGMESVIRVGKKRAGRELDGREWNDLPGKISASDPATADMAQPPRAARQSSIAATDQGLTGPVNRSDE